MLDIIFKKTIKLLKISNYENKNNIFVLKFIEINNI